MEDMNLYHLSLFIEEDLVIIEEDIRKYQLSEKLKVKHEQVFKEEPNGSGNLEGNAVNEPGEEYLEELFKIDYEGNFEKGVLIIYQGGLHGEVRDFLMKILGAVECSLKDVALVSASHLQELHEQSINHLNPHKCLVFGSVNHPIIKQKQECYEIIGGETDYLFADDLKEIAESTLLKKKLWACLQVLFHIKK